MKAHSNLRIGFRRACLLVLGALLGPSSAPIAWAVSADPTPFEFTQPDGSKITLRLRGDEFFHWHEDLNGFTVMIDGNRFVYAVTNAQQRLAATAWEVGKVAPETMGLRKGILPSTKLRPGNANKNLPLYQPWLTAPSAPPAGRQMAATRALGTVKNLVVLCKFKDHVWGVHTRDRADYDVLFNAVGGHAALAPSGSVRDYYGEASYGQVAMQSTVLAWVELPKSESDYGDVVAAGGARDYAGSKRMIVDALDLVKATVNFADFDLNADGAIDAITFIRSGWGAEVTGSPGLIWSHKGRLPTPWKSGNVAVTDYHTEPALHGRSGTDLVHLGTICHELGHFFGLPDLYDIDYSSQGIGSWCLMGNSWGFDNSALHPPHFSAWCKVQLGWVTPTVLTAPGLYAAAQAESSPTVYRIDHGFPRGEYLLIENRQPVGFESDIPQGGLAIWHIDEDKATTDNTDNAHELHPSFPGNGDHYRVALLQADGRYDLESANGNRGDAGDLYHAGGQRFVGLGTVPNTDSYQFGLLRPTGIRIEGISAASPTMTFWYNVTSAIWVDARYTGSWKFGFLDYPFNTFSDGYNAASAEDTIFLRGARYTASPPTLTKRVTLRTWDGPTTLGR